jgi:pyruvate dehydrogenase E2 component (dihydrolipoamide acetyltransferase)
MYDVTMPKLSDSMEVGKIIEWKVKPGDAVHEGDVLATVESDKAAMDLECFHDGVIDEIVRENEEEVKVGEVIARIRRTSEKSVKGEKGVKGEKDKSSREPKASAPAAERPDEAEGVRAEKRAKGVKGGKSEKGVKGTVRISPYARKLAEQKGIDYTQVKGSGPGGRIIARDIEGGVPAPVGREPPASEPAPPAPAPAPVVAELPPIEVTEAEATVEPAPFRLRTQARRVTAAKHTIPHFYLTLAVDATRLVERQRALKAALGATLTHLVMLACLKTLEKHPEVNRSYDRDQVITWKGMNLGLAVDTPEGLTVAVLRGAEDLSLRGLIERTTALVGKARTGQLAIDERRHATFTITNLGMFRVDEFAPIINPPSAITLAVASALPATVVRDDAIHIGRVMKLTAACDHRIVDGVTAARFMQDLAGLLESPDALG